MTPAQSMYNTDDTGFKKAWYKSRDSFSKHHLRAGYLMCHWLSELIFFSLLMRFMFMLMWNTICRFVKSTWPGGSRGTLLHWSLLLLLVNYSPHNVDMTWTQWQWQGWQGLISRGQWKQIKAEKQLQPPWKLQIKSHSDQFASHCAQKVTWTPFPHTLVTQQ